MLIPAVPNRKTLTDTTTAGASRLGYQCRAQQRPHIQAARCHPRRFTLQHSRRSWSRMRVNITASAASRRPTGRTFAQAKLGMTSAVYISDCLGLRSGLEAKIKCLALQTYVQAECWLSRTSQSQCFKQYLSLVHRYSTRLLALVPIVYVSKIDVFPPLIVVHALYDHGPERSFHYLLSYFRLVTLDHAVYSARTF
jgi:hypothetical protein